MLLYSITQKNLYNNRRFEYYIPTKTINFFMFIIGLQIPPRGICIPKRRFSYEERTI
ncbi:hypothetical protein HMPREF1987_01845 [Peptostreptococcaceae bacterium oral taxon 113 str. W5053]|nr:hypothetical protein HMPREF1987_01845 [Peptostreptococcaceae bacterium oral taxon 113 str. W5053]